ncbi:hypothetical protein [Neobacillus cucumis]|uniref:hypothetical protein n=1 Tax=Neobacillus cucumis TaxID=1740721 RepID=UPI0019638C35|nr:hypothetical protein [Neobacillus cucumis]MBM7652592.1 DNA-binding transcriptional MerR regulator [Neobacillus cucumis]
MEEIYSPSYVQDLLGIDGNTLRKYATLLEGHGYPIHRNPKGHRGYFDKDVSTLRQLIKYYKQDGVPLEQAAISVITDVSEKTCTEPLAEVVPLQTSTETVSVATSLLTTNDQDMKQECNLETSTEPLAEVVPLQSSTETVTETASLLTTNDQDMKQECNLETSTGTVTEATPLLTTDDQDMKQECNHDELLERIEHLEQINLDLIKILKEKVVREAAQEEKLNRILKYVERTEQYLVERSKLEEETRRQVAAASQKKWWQWWK